MSEPGLERLLRALSHRGEEVETVRRGRLELGTRNRGTGGHFRATICRVPPHHVLVDGWIEGVDGGGPARPERGEQTARWVASRVHAKGPHALADLEGAFLAVVGDERSGDLWIFRDVCGLRPAYYWTGRDACVVASELKAVLELPEVDRSLDPEVLAHLLVVGLEPCDRSLVGAVRKVPPGKLLRIRPGATPRVELSRTPVEAQEPMEMREAADRIREALEQGLRSRIGDHDSAGVFLSGGVDSYLVCETLTRVSTGRVEAGTAGVGGFEADEREDARALADHLGIPHVSAGWQTDEDVSLVHLIQRAVETTEQPARYANAPLVVRLLDQWPRLPEVLLSGDAADNLFGDAGFHRLSRVRTLRHLPGRRKLAGAAARLARSAAHRGHPIARLARLLDADPGNFSLYVSEVFEHRHVGRLLGFDPAEELQAHFSELRAEVSDASPGQRYSYLNLRSALQGLIDKLERLVSAAGADIVHPFLMPGVLRKAFRMPDRLRRLGGEPKPVIHHLVAPSLPPELRERDKRGFGAPRTRWLINDPGLREVVRGLTDPDSFVGGQVDRDELRTAVDDFLRRGRRSEYRDNLWILVSVELWARAVSP